ncbi:hypothetical protein CapIbe_007324 [Capra ibex]
MAQNQGTHLNHPHTDPQQRTKGTHGLQMRTQGVQKSAHSMTKFVPKLQTWNPGINPFPLPRAPKQDKTGRQGSGMFQSEGFIPKSPDAAHY